jgi:hypothetical protein
MKQHPETVRSVSLGPQDKNMLIARSGRWRKFLAALEDGLVVVVVDLVEIIGPNGTVMLNCLLELGTWNKTNPAIEDANHSYDMRLSPAGSIDG